LFLDPEKLLEAQPAEVLDAAARGHLGLDHRFLHALLDRPEQALPAVVAFGERDRSNDVVDLASELIALFRHWKTSLGVPFLVKYIEEDPENVPDEVVVGLVETPAAALEPVLALYDRLEETASGEVAFILANLRIRDERILQRLLDRLEFDLSDTFLLLGIYGDPAAKAAVEKAIQGLEGNEGELKEEAAAVLGSLSEPAPVKNDLEQEPFDIWDLYAAKEDPPVDLLDDAERFELLKHPAPSVRAAAAHSFFNHQLETAEREQLLALAKTDESLEVRARAWEALIDATEVPQVVEAMLQALRDPALPVEEKGGLLVGLAPEADRNEVRQGILELYAVPAGRAKALEAMWRSVHPSFRDYFASNLHDPDLEVRRGALWGVGYYGLKSELDQVRKLFQDEDLRSDALFAYALALPAEVSRGRMNGLLARVEKDAQGLSEMEEELVKAALDERLMLAGKEPVFHSHKLED
jgi:HEAT repeat protein